MGEVWKESNKNIKYQYINRIITNHRGREPACKVNPEIWQRRLAHGSCKMQNAQAAALLHKYINFNKNDVNHKENQLNVLC